MGVRNIGKPSTLEQIETDVKVDLPGLNN